MKLLGWGSGQTEISVDLRSLGGAAGEIFYSESGQAHSADRRIPFVVVADGQWHTYDIQISKSLDLDRIRIDPGSEDGDVDVRSLSFGTSGGAVHLEGEALSEALLGLNMMARRPSETSFLRFTAMAPDPYVDFQMPARSGVPAVWGRVLPWFAAATSLALLWLAVGEWLRRRVQIGFRRLRVSRLFSSIAGHLSDPEVLIVPPRAVALVSATVVCAALYVMLNLHQSSIGIWETMFATTPIEQTVDLGTPREIRSDEWNTQTPWVLGQVARGMEVHNVSVGGVDAPLLASVPVSHSSAIAQVKFYGFYLFDAETGFSWWWAYKTFALLLSFFWLFLLLTKGDVAASALGAVWVYGSSATQWWFSSSLPELLTAFGLATIGGIYLLFSVRRSMVAVGALLISYGVLNLLLHLYPAFILPLAYLGVAILSGLMLEPGRLRVVKQDLRWRASCLAIATVVVGILGGKYLLDALPSIEVMANTLYPGHRIATSGDMTGARMFYGFFEALRVGENRLPLPPTNASEASSFLVFTPLLVLAIPLMALFKRRNALLVTLLVYCLAVGVWICVHLPMPLERIMQAAGWGWAPPIRAVVGLGIASIIAAIVFFSRVRVEGVELRSVLIRRFIPIAVFLAVFTLGWWLRKIDPVFFAYNIILLGSLAAALVVAGLVLGRIGFLVGGLAVSILPAMLVNPLVSGLSSLDEKPILVAAMRQSDIEIDRWAVFGSFVFSQGLKSQGLEVVTGSQMIPSFATAEIFDPERQFDSVWNRYAHVMFRSEPGLTKPRYELLSPDLYVVSLDVCGPQLRELGVTRIAFTEAVPASDLGCLVPLPAPVDSGVQLFRLAPERSSEPR